MNSALNSVSLTSKGASSVTTNTSLLGPPRNRTPSHLLTKKPTLGASLFASTSTASAILSNSPRHTNESITKFSQSYPSPQGPVVAQNIPSNPTSMLSQSIQSTMPLSTNVTQNSYSHLPQTSPSSFSSLPHHLQVEKQTKDIIPSPSSSSAITTSLSLLSTTKSPALSNSCSSSKPSLTFDMNTLLGNNDEPLQQESSGTPFDLDKEFKYSIIPSYVKEITQDIIKDYHAHLVSLRNARQQYEAYKQDGPQNPIFQVNFSKALLSDPDSADARQFASCEIRQVLLEQLLKSKACAIKELEEKIHQIHLVRRYLDELNQLFKDISVEEKMEQNINRLVKREAIKLFQKVDQMKASLSKETGVVENNESIISLEQEKPTPSETLLRSKGIQRISSPIEDILVADESREFPTPQTLLDFHNNTNETSIEVPTLKSRSSYLTTSTLFTDNKETQPNRYQRSPQNPSSLYLLDSSSPPLTSRNPKHGNSDSLSDESSKKARVDDDEVSGGSSSGQELGVPRSRVEKQRSSSSTQIKTRQSTINSGIHHTDKSRNQATEWNSPSSTLTDNSKPTTMVPMESPLKETFSAPSPTGKSSPKQALQAPSNNGMLNSHLLHAANVMTKQATTTSASTALEPSNPSPYRSHTATPSKRKMKCRMCGLHRTRETNHYKGKPCPERERLSKQNPMAHSQHVARGC